MPATHNPMTSGNKSIPFMTWAELIASLPPSVDRAGLHVWCTDYPSVGGYGAEVVCTGTRWKSISQQHCLLSPPSVPDGLLFAVGAAAALYGGTVFIPGGVLQPDDNVRLLLIAQHPTIGTANRRVDLRLAATVGGVIGGTPINGFAHSNSSNSQLSMDKYCTFVNETTSRSSATSQANSGVTTTSSQVSNTLPSIANDLHMGIVVAPSSDTSWLLFAASAYVEFAR